MGCTTKFTARQILITHNGRTVAQHNKSSHESLWHVGLLNTSAQAYASTGMYTSAPTNSSSDNAFVQFMHAAFGSPALSSLKHAIRAIQIQREVFILKGDYITPQDAEEFQEQAHRLPRLRINECMHRMASDLLHVKICTDQTSLSMLTPEQKHDWQNPLTIKHVAILIMQYFSTNKQADQTLAELFGKIPFHYSLSSNEEELATYMAYRELITDYERTHHITAA